MAITTSLIAVNAQVTAGVPHVVAVPTLNNAESRLAFVAESVLFTFHNLDTLTGDGYYRTTLKRINTVDDVYPEDGDTFIAQYGHFFSGGVNDDVRKFVQLPFPFTLAEDQMYFLLEADSTTGDNLLVVTAEVLGSYTKLTELEWIKARCPEA